MNTHTVSRSQKRCELRNLSRLLLLRGNKHGGSAIALSKLRATHTVGERHVKLCRETSGLHGRRLSPVSPSASQRPLLQPRTQHGLQRQRCQKRRTQRNSQRNPRATRSAHRLKLLTHPGVSLQCCCRDDKLRCAGRAVGIGFSALPVTLPAGCVHTQTQLCVRSGWLRRNCRAQVGSGSGSGAHLRI